ncbi:MAG: UDP-N-acetylmuramoyl-L-alanine--D-glutamate ligase [Anaerolineae bacterium]
MQARHAIAPENWRHVRALIVGAAREGTALARYLSHWGAEVTLSDAKPAGALREALAGLAEAGVSLRLGESHPSLEEVDILFVSPGVPPSAPVVQQARARGLPISSEPRLFTQTCAAPVVGVTGSSGKTTTTALTGKMYSIDGRRTWVGGNIGAPLTERLLEDERPDVAVMELSSFQLELFSPGYQGAEVEQRRSDASRVLSVAGWSPRVAAVTNVTPNHLDRHPDMDDYVRAKTNILAFQRSEDTAVLNADDATTRAMAALSPARIACFSLVGPVNQGAYLDGRRLALRLDGRERTLCDVAEIRLRGRHNIANVLAAACCALAGGVSLDAMHEAIVNFTGVEHRLEPVRTLCGVTYVNDSIATSPERAMAALRSYDEPLVLLAGGRDKHLPWEDWADLAIERARLVVAFGEAAGMIAEAVQAALERRGGAATGPLVHEVSTLADAVAVAAREARSGDVVLLSPGGTSFDAFVDFEARGRAFRDMVTAL